MQALTILKRAAALIDSGRWLKEAFSNDARKINVRTGRRRATGKAVTCFCAVGAVRHAAGGTHRPEYLTALEYLEKAIGVQDEDDIFSWNDDQTRTVGHVRKAFRKAIKLAAA